MAPRKATPKEETPAPEARVKESAPIVLRCDAYPYLVAYAFEGKTKVQFGEETPGLFTTEDSELAYELLTIDEITEATPAE